MEYVEPIREREKIETVKRILKCIGMRDFLLFLMGINSGLRISDIIKLRVSDVKNKDYIEITEQKNKQIQTIPNYKFIQRLLE